MRRTAGGWLRLFVTFVAIAGILTRASLPLPQPSLGGPDTTLAAVGLAALGASLCHHDDGGDPGGVAVCDHCDMCAVVVPVLPSPGILPAPTMLAELALPAGLNPVASPRAPPARAHNPRAPPVLI